MATRTSTETKREITRRGNVIIVKEVEKTTTYVPGKEPMVKETTKIQEYKGVEDLKKLPEDIRRQLEGPSQWEAIKSNSKQATKGNFAEEFLSEHNRYRKIHGVNPLKLSTELMKVSQKRAESLASTDEMRSRSDHSYGENLSCLWSNDSDHTVQASEVVSMWYAEQKDYNYEEEPRDLKAGHFTQMIWEQTTELGVAAAKSASNRIYVVASYKPPGNYVGEFKNNVHPPGFAAKPSKSFFDMNFGSSKSQLPSKKTAKGDEESSKKSGETSMSDLNKECLACHNEFRNRHGVPLLKYSRELANYAQQWANELALRDRMEHRKERKYGENLYCFKSTNPQAVATATEACKSWYSEIQHYDFDSEPRSLTTGHFTQMVWKETSEVGMGLAKSKTGLQIIVANYNPPGNFIGTFRFNVPRPVK